MPKRLPATLVALILGSTSLARAQTDPGSMVRPNAPAEGYDFVFSAVGPGAGKGAIALGGRVFLIVPTFDVNYARGFTDELDLVLNMSTLGVITFADLGLRFRFAGGPESGFSLGAKAALTPIVFFLAFGDNTTGGAAFAGTPGLVASFGSERVQFSLTLDFPLFFGGGAFVTGDGGGTGSGTGFEPIFRPGAAIEFPVGASTNLYIQLQGYTSLENGGFFGPVVAVGAAW